MTISMMIKFSSLAGNPIIFESGDFGSATLGYHLLTYRADSYELRWYFNRSNGAGFYNASFAFAPAMDRIYHLAITQEYASGQVSFYLDGVLVGSSGVGPGLAALPIVNRSATLFSGLDAQVDELALFDGALSSARINAQFKASRLADPSAAVYYAAPAGAIYGRGTRADPLDLASAINSGFLEPGKTLELLEGRFTGVYVVNQSGSADQRIKILGELGKRVTLDGEGLAGPVMRLNGSYIDVGRLEIKKTWAVRTSDVADTQNCPIQGTNGPVGGSGVADFGDFNSVYHNVIHDNLGEGIGAGPSTKGSEYYGNLIFNNGWFAPRTVGGEPAANGHGFYLQNTAPSMKTLKFNILFNSYASPIKLAGSGASKVENFDLEGNLSIGGGFAYDVGGGDTGADNVSLLRERTYLSDMKLGYNTSAGRTISIRDSYLYGYQFPLSIDNFNSIVSTGNTIIGNGDAGGGSILIRVKTAYANSVIDDNAYYQNWANRPMQMYLGTGLNAPLDSLNLSSWRATTGWDAHSTYSADGTNTTKPTVNKVIVQPTKSHESNRGYVAIYNWANAQTQSVNLSSVLEVGAHYQIRSVSNYFAGVIISGVYAGGSVTLPLSLASGLPAMALPYGDIARGPEPGPDFAAFVIEPLL